MPYKFLLLQLKGWAINIQIKISNTLIHHKLITYRITFKQKEKNKLLRQCLDT